MIDVHIRPRDCPEITESCKRAVLKMQGRLKQSSVVPFKGEQDQIGIRIENSQIYCSALGKIEMKLIVE